MPFCTIHRKLQLICTFRYDKKRNWRKNANFAHKKSHYLRNGFYSYITLYCLINTYLPKGKLGSCGAPTGIIEDPFLAKSICILSATPNSLM